jgi:hypothetical protein
MAVRTESREAKAARDADARYVAGLVGAYLADPTDARHDAAARAVREYTHAWGVHPVVGRHRWRADRYGDLAKYPAAPCA